MTKRQPDPATKKPAMFQYLQGHSTCDHRMTLHHKINIGYDLEKPNSIMTHMNATNINQNREKMNKDVMQKWKNKTINIILSFQLVV